MESLVKILRRAESGLEDGWLYLANDYPWVLQSKGKIIDVDELDESEVDEEDEPLFAKENKLLCTLDSRTIEDIVSSAKHINPPFSDDLLLECFNYFYEYDAFLPEPGYKPPPKEEWQRNIDSEFYELLGEEQKETNCKSDVCQKGTVKGSVFCKVHHFEMIHKRPCPFSD